jgi:hypothetical protein
LLRARIADGSATGILGLLSLFEGGELPDAFREQGPPAEGAGPARSEEGRTTSIQVSIETLELVSCAVAAEAASSSTDGFDLLTCTRILRRLDTAAEIPNKHDKIRPRPTAIISPMVIAACRHGSDRQIKELLDALETSSGSGRTIDPWPVYSESACILLDKRGILTHVTEKALHFRGLLGMNS